MFNLVYLSTENRRALEILQERLTRSTDRRRRQDMELAIQDLLAREKPYTECDLFEADELRSQLLSKASILSRLGKSAEPFLIHVKNLDLHIQTLQMKEALQEAERLKTEEPANLTEKAPTVNNLKKERERKTAFGGTRWKIGFDDEPDDAETKK